MAQNRQRYLEAMQQGQASIEAGQWPVAARAFRAAIAEFPHELAPFAGLGEACFQLKQYDRALDCFKLAARHSGGDIVYLERVADIQERLGQLSEASRTYMAAGELKLRQRQLDEAIGHWERAVRLQPGLLGAHQRLAMVFHRQQDRRNAIREYLAIARILQMQGDKAKALQVCEAALRLDPGNQDVLTAMKLVRHGAEAFPEPEPELATPPPPASSEEEDESLAGAIRQMTRILEAERPAAAPAPAPLRNDPISQASRMAQEQLAEEILRDVDDERVLYGLGDDMSKLERDALIGQGIDFQARGDAAEAASCYEKAIAGGLRLPAAHFVLGLLYLELQDRAAAERHLAQAAEDTLYRQPSQLAMAQD